MAKKNKKSPFQLGGASEPAPEYTISKKVQAILDDPELDSDGLSLKDRAVLVFELGKRLVADEDAEFHQDYLRHAAPLVAAGPKAYGWVFSALGDLVDENAAENGDNWYPVLPFMMSDDNGTVEEAAELICIHHPGDGKDRLVGPADVLTSMVNRSQNLGSAKGKAREAAVRAIAGGFATVLFCADLRLLPLLGKAWDELADEVKEVLYQIFDGRISELQVEFYLAILERSKPGSDDFERAALHLSHCVSPGCMPIIRDEVTVDRVTFDFGLHKGPEELHVVAQTPARKYLAKIEPRLRALQPKSPKLIDDILSAWQSA